MTETPHRLLVRLALYPEGTTPKERALDIADAYGRRDALYARLADCREPQDLEHLLCTTLNNPLPVPINDGTIDTIIGEKDKSWLRSAYETCARITKVAAKGTWYAARNLKLHYPVVGALPGHVQEKIAKKYDEHPIAYVASNSVAEFLLVSAAIAYLVESTQGSPRALYVGIVAGTIELCIGTARTQMAQPNDKKHRATFGSPLAGIVYWPARAMIAGGKKVIAMPPYLAQKIRDGYAAAWQEEQSNTPRALDSSAIQARVEIEEEERGAHAIEGDHTKRTSAKALRG